MIIKNRGKLNFFSSKRTLNFEIDLNSYYENAQEIKNSINTVHYLCKLVNEPFQCDIFKESYKRDWLKIENNVNYIKKCNKRRNKRWIGGAFRLAKF